MAIMIAMIHFSLPLVAHAPCRDQRRDRDPSRTNYQQMGSRHKARHHKHNAGDWTDMDHQDNRKPDWDEYYMGIAMSVRSRADCVGNRVGAILVLDDRIISTGYNGTPANMTNCTDGGCERCMNREKYAAGTFYDLCICVHAEQNALLAAARFGIATEGAVLYSTMRPCFGCTKELLQAGVRAVHYLHDWIYPDPQMQASYALLQSQFPDGVHDVEIEDARASWALSRMRSD